MHFTNPFSVVLQNRRFNHWIVWLLFWSLFFFYVGFILPGKGFDFTDHGYYLYSGFAYLLHQQPMDALTALRPGSLINGFFMLFGIKNYLSISVIFFILLVTGPAVLLFGITKKIKETLYYPLVLAATFSCFFTSVASYQNLPPILISFALGFFFLNSKRGMILSALFFVLTGFSNLPLLPVIGLGVLLPFFQTKNTPDSRHYFWGTLALFFLCIGIPYLLAVSQVRWVSSENQAYLAKAFYSVWPALKLFGICLGSGFLLRLGLMKINNNRNVWVFIAIILFVTCACLFKLIPLKAEVVMFSICILGAILFYSPNAIGKKIALAIVVVTFCFLNQCATTGSTLMFTMYENVWISLFAASVFNASFHSKEKYVVMGCFAFLVGCSISVGLYHHLHFAYRSSAPIEKEMQTLDSFSLKGVKVPSNKAQLITQLKAVYEENDCQKKVFLALADQPLLYYFFERLSPTGSSWEPGVMLNHLNETKIIKNLHAVKKWCIFITQGNRSEETWLKTLPTLRNMLNQESNQVIRVATSQAKTIQSHPELYQIYIK